MYYLYYNNINVGHEMMITRVIHNSKHEPRHTHNAHNQRRTPAVGAGPARMGRRVSALQGETRVQPGASVQLQQPVHRVPRRKQPLSADPHPVLGHGGRASNYGLRRRAGVFAGCGPGELVPRAQLPDVGVSRLHLRPGAPRAQVLRVPILVAPVFPTGVVQPHRGHH